MAASCLARPPRPRSRGGNVRSLSIDAPSFLPRPVKEPRSPSLQIARESSCPAPVPVDPPRPQPITLGSPPKELDLPLPLPPGLSMSPTRRLSQPNATLPKMGPLRQVRRSRSEAPPLPTCLEEGMEDTGCSRPPLIRNVAAFEKPRECSKALCNMPALRRMAPQANGSSRSSARRNRIDEAIQREMFGDGIALEDAVDARRDAGWAVKHRHLQRCDIGHCCYACRQPLRDVNEEVVVWTGAAIYRRFHPQCAASYVLRADSEKSSASSGCRDSVPSDVVESYADGWRALPRDDMGSGRSQRAVQAARQWLLSQDPSAFSELRGDLFTTVTITENGKKKAVPGLSHEQLVILQTKHKWKPSGQSEEDLNSEDCLECPICFANLDSRSAPCIRLPCAPQHVCHVDCVLPWLRKACICPVCRKDLRPLLPPARGSSR